MPESLPPKGASRPTNRSAGRSALLALASLGVGLGTGWWIATQADLLDIRFDRAYFVLLVVLGLAAAAFLFGVLRSSATLTGKHLGVGFEVGGAAAIFLLVVWGGLHLTAPPESFTAMVHLRYAGPPVDPAAFDEALPRASLIVRFGSGSRELKVNGRGEAVLADVPGRFLDGTITVELVSDRIVLVEHDASRAIPMPSPDAPTTLKAALREPEERRRARESARADLEQAIAAAQRGLVAQSGALIPALDEFLASPSEDRWRRVLRAAERVRAEIERGFDAALDYDSRYSGLLAQPEQVRQLQSDASRVLSAPRMEFIVDRDRPPWIFDRVHPHWGDRVGILQATPDPSRLDDVRAWRDRLQGAYQAVLHALEPITAQLRVEN